jgi:histidinol-phosphatase
MRTPIDLADELKLALELADLADEIVRASFRPDGFAFENKYDGSPVTAIDRAVEQAIRERVATVRPDHVVLGEEAGLGVGERQDTPLPRKGVTRVAGGRSRASRKPLGASRPRWIVDPIDGTRKFVRGIPIFATLLGLEVDGEIVVGVASAPMMERTGRRWWAARGLGAFADGRPIRVSPVARLEDAHVVHGSIEQFARRGWGNTLLEIATRAWGTTGYGDFWIHLLVAEGAADAAVESQAAVWDVAALKIIVEEAGGRFTDFAGRSTAAGGTGLSTNGLLHDEILGLLRV